MRGLCSFDDDCAHGDVFVLHIGLLWPGGERVRSVYTNSSAFNNED